MLGKKIRDFLPEEDLLAYSEAILRVYNMHGRRDNKYKARIKILVHETGMENIGKEIEAEFEANKNGVLHLPEEEVRRIAAYFAPPAYATRPDTSASLERARTADPAFDGWVKNNVSPHRVPGYAIVTVSLKPIGGVPGDATAEQLDAVADITDRLSFGEIRVSHEQNLVLPHVAKDDLKALYDELVANGLATANAGLVTDIIACPGLDYCALANARSIPIAERISERFADAGRQQEIGALKIKISGCINACGHHHAGHIGILGVDRKGEEFYQITLGGSGDETASIGEIIGKGFSTAEVVDAVETVVNTYVSRRESAGETFLQAYRRLGPTPFKEALYGSA
jgi:sulfite reductase (NADPH) hemoprotein beta-component